MFILASVRTVKKTRTMITNCIVLQEQQLEPGLSLHTSCTWLVILCLVSHFPVENDHKHVSTHDKYSAGTSCTNCQCEPCHLPVHKTTTPVEVPHTAVRRLRTVSVIYHRLIGHIEYSWLLLCTIVCLRVLSIYFHTSINNIKIVGKYWPLILIGSVKFKEKADQTIFILLGRSCWELIEVSPVLPCQNGKKKNRLYIQNVCFVVIVIVVNIVVVVLIFEAILQLNQL